MSTSNATDRSLKVTEESSSESATPTAPSTTAVDIPVSPNPWGDSKEPTPGRETKPLSALDPTAYDDPVFAGLKDTSSSTSAEEAASKRVSKEVLSEFDPLAIQEEKAARDAWESSEGHPPPPRTPSPPPKPPAKDDLNTTPPSTKASGSAAQAPAPSTPAPAPAAGASGSTSTVPASSSSPFPSFASLAKSFALPLRPRPQSLDASAKAVPSPSTLSSFAAQQDAARPDTGKAPAAAPASQPSSGPGSPAPKPNDGSFDFQKFLDQMKTRSAEPVSKYLRSFLSNFAKRTFTVNDQVKIINDFLSFIATQMRECDVWKNASEVEFENAMEGMEKLVMNRLYDFTFTPQLERQTPPRPVTTDDLERDRVLAQRIALFGWLEEKHLDIPEGEGSKGFLMFAEQELLKINHYKAPRDKLICILNSCKVIFGLIRHLHKEEGADSFVPILIFVVLKANPEHLLSNVEFINRFRNPSKLQSEAGYYLSSLMGAVSFIETMDHTSLSNITQEEFEKKVEEAIQSLPSSEPDSPDIPFAEMKIRAPTPASPHAGEESAQPLSLSAAPAQTLSEDAKRLFQKTGDTISKPLSAIGRIFSEALDGAENKLSYLPGPFAPFELGRENRQDGSSSATHPSSSSHWSYPGSSWEGQATPRSAPPQTPSYGHEAPQNAIQTPYKPRVRRVPSPSLHQPSPGASPGWGPPDTPSRGGPYSAHPQGHFPGNTLVPPRVQSLAQPDWGAAAAGEGGNHISRTPTPALDFAGVQQQIDTAHEQAAKASKETLMQIFPGVDVEVVEWVLEANDGDLGKSIEQLLDISGES